jgi:starch synthase
VPIVRATGGLNDTVSEGPEGNGFRFHPYDARYLSDAIGRCLAIYEDKVGWNELRERGMREDHSWAASAQQYIGMYAWAMQTIGR